MCNIYIKMFSLQGAENLCVLAGVNLSQSDVLPFSLTMSLLLFVLDISGFTSAQT